MSPRTGSQFKCIVPGCDYKDQSRRFHKFPADPERCRLWTEFCQRPARRPKPLEAVCDLHFRDEDYQPGFRILGRPRKWWKLKLDAVPVLRADVRVSEGDPEEVEMEIVFPDNVLQMEEDDGIIQEEVLLEEEYILEEEEVLPTSKCRLCLSNVSESDENLMNLYVDRIEDQECLAKLLNNFFQLELEDYPEWPSLVCGLCVNFLLQMNEFKKMILHSHSVLYDEIEARAKELQEGLGQQQEDEQLTEEPEDELPAIEEQTAEPVGKVEEEDSQSVEAQDVEEDESLIETEDDEEMSSPQRTTTRKQKRPRITRKSTGVTDTAIEVELEALMRQLDVLKCSICGQPAESMDSLSLHLRQLHKASNAWIVCCGAKRLIRQTALEHMSYHLNNKAFPCPQCHEFFTDNKTLKAHTRTVHPEVRKYKCLTCNKTFALLNRFRTHQLTHLSNNDRPLKCNYCQAGFVDKQSLRRHTERLHEVEQRHQCEDCGTSFSNYGTYRQHYYTKHKYEDECRLCKRKVNDLQSHMKQSHAIELNEAEVEKMREKPGGLKVTCEICEEVVNKKDMRSHREKEHGSKYPCRCCDTVRASYKSWYNHMSRNHLEAYRAIVAKRNFESSHWKVDARST